MKNAKESLQLLLAALLCLSLLPMAVLASGETSGEVQIDGSETAVIEDSAEEPVAEPADELANDGAGSVPIDAAHFPNAVFRGFVADEFDVNGDGFLSAAEAVLVTDIRLPDDYRIDDLTGLQYFTALETLWCMDLAITSLDMSPFPQLNSLECFMCVELANVDVTRNPLLENLDLEYCENLGSIDLSRNAKLKNLYCPGCAFEELDLSGTPRLDTLFCYDNLLTSLDLSHTPELIWLICGENQLTELDLSVTPGLEHLSCDSNLLTELDLSFTPRLESLSCSSNLLTELDLSFVPGLKELSCDGNLLAELDLSFTPELESLSCGGNRLTAIDLTTVPELYKLNCAGSTLSRLNLSPVTDLCLLNCEDCGLDVIDISPCAELVNVYRSGQVFKEEERIVRLIAVDVGNPRTEIYTDPDYTVFFNCSAMLSADYGQTIVTTAGTAPSPTPTPEPTATPEPTSIPLPDAAVTISADGKTAKAVGDFGRLYARVALILDNNGQSGLYITQVTINTNGTIVIPAFMVPGLTVKGVNIALVPTLDDISSATPTVVTSASIML